MEETPTETRIGGQGVGAEIKQELPKNSMWGDRTKKTLGKKCTECKAGRRQEK